MDTSALCHASMGAGSYPLIEFQTRPADALMSRTAKRQYTTPDHIVSVGEQRRRSQDATAPSSDAGSTRI